MIRDMRATPREQIWLTAFMPYLMDCPLMT